MNLDLRRDMDEAASQLVHFVGTESGVANAVVFFFTAHLDNVTRFG
jgi:hypothetical protein